MTFPYEIFNIETGEWERGRRKRTFSGNTETLKHIFSTVPANFVNDCSLIVEKTDMKLKAVKKEKRYGFT